MAAEHLPVAKDVDQSVGLRCPRCGSDVAAFACSQCGFLLHWSRGIMHALPPERIAHYARFIEEYERVRAAEGRGGDSPASYLDLPYNDGPGGHRAQWRIRAC